MRSPRPDRPSGVSGRAPKLSASRRSSTKPRVIRPPRRWRPSPAPAPRRRRWRAHFSARRPPRRRPHRSSCSSGMRGRRARRRRRPPKPRPLRRPSPPSAGRAPHRAQNLGRTGRRWDCPAEVSAHTCDRSLPDDCSMPLAQRTTGTSAGMQSASCSSAARRLCAGMTARISAASLITHPASALALNFHVEA